MNSAEPAATSIQIADATAACARDLARIYGHYVLHETCTFEVDPPSDADMLQRLQSVQALGLPFLVARVGDAVVGFAYAGRYRDRPAYRHTVENSVYLAPDWHGRGIGQGLLDTLIDRCCGGELRQMVAVIGDSANTRSVTLHARAGFRHVGTLRDVGFKHGRWLDTVIMQRELR